MVATPDIQSHRLPNTYLRQFFRFLGSAPALLQGTEQSSQSLSRLDGTNSFRDYCHFFCNAMEQLQDPAIGLSLGQVNQLANMHGALSVAVLQSSDMGDCLDLMRRFIPLRNPAFQTAWTENEAEVGLEITFREDAGSAHIPVCEALMISLTSIISVVSQRRVKASRIELNYPRPDYAGRYHDALEATAFRFSSDRLAIIINREDAAWRTGVDTDHSLRVSAIQRCEELLQGVFEEQTTSTRVRQLFVDNPGHLWRLTDIASHLHTSPRTLQRRLGAEGTSYQEISDLWLQEETRKLLAERSLSVESIAMLLGYSDVSNLRHACRRWFGMPPQEYRRSLAE